MRFAITGNDPRFPLLREALIADGHEPAPPEEADVLIPPPWDSRARYARSENYLVATAALTAQAVPALLAALSPSFSFSPSPALAASSSSSSSSPADGAGCWGSPWAAAPHGGRVGAQGVELPPPPPPPL